ncbi:MAG: hypothetical protein DWQ54_23015 [Microcystis flos-aquae TF09]|uniref:Type II toxin-antitoxin system VapC family toxin n=1 Tax=Microcystis flos-aquae TF09 TaxID=2060473 RepID=A0A3E0KWN4_9CHRO|nr:MAG: hypothetical protein DWQ54_23015 [Microcystis flos-aquae TF09]
MCDNFCLWNREMLTEKDFYDYFAEETISIGFVCTQKPEEPLLPLTPEITLRAVNLSPVHKDPFDRIIIGTALEYQAKLASIDSLFLKYPELKDYLMSA